MIKWKYWDEAKTRYTTYSDDSTKKLYQVETGCEYNPDATDWVLGHKLINGEQVPYGQYTYTEIPKTQEDLDLEQEIKEMAERQGGDN